MSVTTENAPVQGQTTLQENRAGEGVYASLFEKINLAPASCLGDINDFLDDAALSEASAAERLTAAMQVFMERIRQSGQRVAEQYGRNEMALHLLGELTICAPQLTLGDWEPGLLFEIQARRLKLLRLKAGRSESDKARLMPEMESLIAGLIAIDPARAMVLCG
ncbi:type VI secretion system domain-containing protein [Klebsiella variicola]